MSEKQGYAIRITQNSAITKVMAKEFVDVLKKHNGALLSPNAQTLQEQATYLGTFIFLKKEEAEAFFKYCSNLGEVEVLFEPRRPIVDDIYFKENNV